MRFQIWACNPNLHNLEKFKTLKSRFGFLLKSIINSSFDILIRIVLTKFIKFIFAAKNPKIVNHMNFTKFKWLLKKISYPYEF